jgi:hypothetical protein
VSIESVIGEIEELRLEVTRHPLFFRPWSLQDLRIVMGYHVVAVWDFMALAKTLQRGLTCIDLPWLPPGDPLGARIINEIILAEESDHIESLGFMGSHFELYLAGMEEVGADSGPIERFIASLATGTPMLTSLEASGIPAASQRFIRHTLSLAQRSLHEVAASFLFGREDVIPEMFQRILPLLPSGECLHFRGYLERHIHIDGDEHGPQAKRLLENLCGQNPRRWREAADAAASSLAARRRLWDDVLEAISKQNISENITSDSEMPSRLEMAKAISD